MSKRGVCDVLAEYRAEHARLHREWTEHVGRPGYDKRLWVAKDNEMARRYADEAAGLGHRGPLLP